MHLETQRKLAAGLAKRMDLSEHQFLHSRHGSLRPLFGRIRNDQEAADPTCVAISDASLREKGSDEGASVAKCADLNDNGLPFGPCHATVAFVHPGAHNICFGVDAVGAPASGADLSSIGVSKSGQPVFRI